MLVKRSPHKTVRKVKKKKWGKPTKRNIIKFVKEYCFYMAPIWIFWTYIISFLLTNDSKIKRTYVFSYVEKTKLEYRHPSGKRYKIEFANYTVEKSPETTALYYALVNKITGDINKAKISRIYNYLAGAYLLSDKVMILQRKGSNIKQRNALMIFKRENCVDTLKLEGRMRPDLSPHNLSLVVPSPLPCVSRHKVAVVIPYRDREEHLIALLNTLHPLLQRQQINYRVYVVEQFGNDTFNKGVLMNAGVRESLRDFDFDCFVFHDVDLIPEDDRNMYTCPHMPRHMSVAVDKFNYSLPYTMLVGGVFSIRLDHYLTVNGYSNLYWGWGGEDDDMAYRIKYRKLEIIRPPETIARYSMIKHEHRPESPNAIRTALLRMAKKRSSRDGLNTVKYRVVRRHDSLSHTHLMIDIGRNHRWHFMDSQQRLIINF